MKRPLDDKSRTKQQLIAELEKLRSRLTKLGQLEADHRHTEQALQVKTDQLAAVTEAMTRFVNTGDWRGASADILRSALTQTKSEYGFIGVLVEGPALRVLAFEGVQWNPKVSNEVRVLHQQTLRTLNEQGYLEFTNFDNLFGWVIKQGRAQIFNHPAADPHAGGLPPGHPPLESFLGVPVFRGSKVVGIIGVANRPGGYSGAEQEQIDILCRAASVLYDSYRRRDREAALARQHQQAEEALRESQTRMAAILQSAPIAVYAAQLSGQFRMSWVSERMHQLSGFPATQLLEVPEFWSQRIHPDDRQRVLGALDSTLFEKNGLSVEYRWQRADGQYRWFLDQMVVVRAVDDSPKEIVGTLYDFTERKEAERQREDVLTEVQQAFEFAQSANRVKDEFLATLSHELRTPLNSMVGWLELLHEGLASSDEVLERLENSARAQHHLIEEILQVSQIVQGKFHLEVAPCDPAAVIKAALATVQLAAAAKGIHLHLSLDSTGPILADAGRLQQIFWNLLSNAIKFTDRGGQVDVRLLNRDSHIEIIVSDNGKGISPEFLDHVFERFRQEDSSTTRRYMGLGLGLAIVRHLVELHGGTVAARSEGLGRGATFTITLPAQRPPDAESIDRAGGKLGKPLKHSVRVLVVDDDADTRELLRACLSHFGMQVVTAASAAEAMDALETSAPDVIVSDIAMPGEDGYSLIRKLRARAPGKGGMIPAVALTAFAGAEQGEKLLEAGFQLHVPKPVEPSKLASMVVGLVKPAAPAQDARLSS